MSIACKAELSPRRWRDASQDYDPILILATHRLAATTVTETMRGFGRHGSIAFAQSIDEALVKVADLNPKLIFVERAGPNLDGLAFVRTLRGSVLDARAARVILISDEATVSALRDAQNAGVHEFLVRPFSAVNLLKRLDAVVGIEREWIERPNYVGPCRRRFNSAATVATPDRRKGRKT